MNNLYSTNQLYEMKRQINEAALVGDVDSLRKLLQEDAQALDAFMVECYAETPLHVAAKHGHLEFVEEILRRKPELARKLDSRQSSPLHLAAAKGYLEIAKILACANPDMCSHPDQCRRNPLHIAAINGHVHVLKELVKVRPKATHAETERGETILHACVRFNKLEAMKFLVESICNHESLNFYEFLNSKDYQGNTILHLAVIYKQIETIKFLTSAGTPINVNALNANGFTALDISTQTKREVVDWEVDELLRSVGATSGIDTLMLQTQTSTPPDVANNKKKTVTIMHWMEQERGHLMVVASLIATMAFQVVLSPPGGLWQENKGKHRAGHSILAGRYPGSYNAIMSCNTIGFTMSLSIIVLLISGLPFKFKFIMWILMMVMWAALTTMTLAYVFSLYCLSPQSFEIFKSPKSPYTVLGFCIISWAGLLTILLLVHAIRLIRKAINCCGEQRAWDTIRPILKAIKCCGRERTLP